MPSLIATLGLNWSGFRTGVGAATAHAQAAGARITSALGGAIGHQLAGFASAAAITGAIKHTIEYAETVSQLSQRLGIGTDAIQEWDYALKMSGSSIESARKFFEKLAMSRKSALEGNEDAVKSFKSLGVSVDDLKGKRLEDVARIIAGTFQGKDSQQFIVALREVGGRSAGEMAVAFQEGLGEMIDSAKGAGVVIAESVLNELRQAKDDFTEVWMSFTAGIAPAIAWGASAIKKAWRALSRDATQIVTMLYTGSTKAGEEAAAELTEQYAEQDKKHKEALDRRKKAAGSGGLTDVEQKSETKNGQEKERLAQRLADLQNKHYLDSLTKEEKITEIHRQRVQLAQWLAVNQGRLTEENRLRAQIDLEEMAGQEASLMRDGTKRRGGGLFEATGNARIGAFNSMSPFESSSLDVNRRSEQHLRAIREAMTSNSPSQVTY